MKQSNIPYYNDPSDFDDGLNKYPCSTQYMYYNGAEHKYFLTRQALNFYGLNVGDQYKFSYDNICLLQSTIKL